MKINLRQYPRQYCSIITGSFIIATAVNLFLANHKLAFGGVSGLSILFLELFSVPLHLTLFVISSGLLLWGGIKKGTDFVLKSISAIFMTSVIFIPLTSGLQEVSSHVVVAAVGGAILLGTGVGFILAAGGSSCGPDLVASVYKNRIPVKHTMYTIDGCIFTVGLLVFGLNNIFSLIVLALVPYVVEKVAKCGWIEELIYPPVDRKRVTVTVNYGDSKWQFFL